MLDFEEIDHPTAFLYRHVPTDRFYVLAGFDDDDIPIMQPANLVLRDTTPLLAAPRPVLRLPEHVQSRPRSKPVNGYYSGIAATSVVEGEVLSEEIIPSVLPAVEAIKSLPIEGKMLLPLAILILVFFGLAVPIVPKVVTSIQQASAPPPPPVASGKATDRLKRISQLDAGQYDPGQYDAYSPSSCSASSLTVAFNAWGGSYKIGKILSYEISIGVINPSQGLTDLAGITKTANRFGFDVQVVSGLDQAISTANAGTPVIADIMPGSAWPGGHFLVVKGGSDSEVTLIDSWTTDFQTISRSRFLGWGLGQFQAISPARYSLLQGHPTLSADQVNAVLAANHSPATGSGQDIFSMSQDYGIDDAYILATFAHESTWGKAGVAAQSKSPGNLRCASWLTWGTCQNNYTYFSSWTDGFKSLYILLSGSYYSGAGNNTPDTCVPIFAPNSDGNSESSYIASLKTGIDELRAGKTQF